MEILYVVVNNNQRAKKGNGLWGPRSDHIFSWKVLDDSTPPAKKTEPSNLVLRAQDHKKNPKFKGWQ
jgi:hypothetical protein